MQNNLQPALYFRLIRRMTSRIFPRITNLAALGLAVTLGQAAAAPSKALVCFGSYSPADRESVHLFQLDLKDGSLKKLSAVSGLKNPSFLKTFIKTFHHSSKFIIPQSSAFLKVPHSSKISTKYSSFLRIPLKMFRTPQNIPQNVSFFAGRFAVVSMTMPRT